jgi:hypothetical protein
MHNLYRKVAVTCVGIALSFALGANKEAKAAIIILTPVTSFGVTDQNRDELGDSYYSGVPFRVSWDTAFYEFNISNLSASTVISSAIFQFKVDSLYAYHRYYGMEFIGYVGNGQPDALDFSPDVTGYYTQVPRLKTSAILGGFTVKGPFPVEKSNFYIDVPVTRFLELIRKNNAFAGFSVRSNYWHVGEAILNDKDASLIITTVDIAEPVPEPTTIFGSALALSVGGWLKRKKSAIQNKTTSQH